MRKNASAVSLGRLGGRVKSERKARSCRLNGAQGGRPSSKGLRDKVLFFDLVDEARRSASFRGFAKMMRSSRRPRERAVINATVRVLAKEMGVEIPAWAKKPIVLKRPYFVSGIENLKASALLESDVEFKLNNVFVLGNFLDRV